MLVATAQLETSGRRAGSVNTGPIEDWCTCGDCTDYRAEVARPRITRQGADLIGLDEILGEAAPYMFRILETGNVLSRSANDIF